MIVGLVTAIVRLPEAASLREKQGQVKALVARALERLNVSVAEIGHAESSQVTELAFVTVAATSAIVQGRIAEIGTFLKSNPRWVLQSLRTEML